MRGTRPTLAPIWKLGKSFNPTKAGRAPWVWVISKAVFQFYRHYKKHVSASDKAWFLKNRCHCDLTCYIFSYFTHTQSPTLETFSSSWQNLMQPRYVAPALVVMARWLRTGIICLYKWEACIVFICLPLWHQVQVTVSSCFCLGFSNWWRFMW